MNRRVTISRASSSRSKRSARGGNGMPSSWCSLSNHAAPSDSSSRPCDAWSIGERLGREHRRVPVGHAGDEQAEPDARRHAGQRGERGHALERLARALAVHRLEVVEAPDAVEAQLLGELHPADQLVPRHALLRHIESESHAAHGHQIGAELTPESPRTAGWTPMTGHAGPGDDHVRGPAAGDTAGVGALTMGGFLDEVAERFGPNEALVFDDPLRDGETVRWTYAASGPRRAASGGRCSPPASSPGDAVGILMGNRPEAVAALFGAALAGAVAVLMSTFAPRPELAHWWTPAGRRSCSPRSACWPAASATTSPPSPRTGRTCAAWPCSASRLGRAPGRRRRRARRPARRARRGHHARRRRAS